MSKKMISVYVDQKDADYFCGIRDEQRKSGKIASAVFHEFVQAHKEKHESELK